MSRAIRTGQTHPIHKSNRDIPIIAVTARVDPDSLARYEDAGVTRCIAKPILKEIINNIIRERIEQII
jgi:CheY-like chemotaxis protein